MALRRAAAGLAGSLQRPGASQFACTRAFSVSLPDLPYDYGELQPVVSARIMELHHSKHHAAYVANFNKTQEQYAEAEKAGNVAKCIALQGALKFNGGGHVNHVLFWQNLTPPKNFEPPSGELLKAIETQFGSVNDFTAKFNAAAAAVQGSGWGWLALNPGTGKLAIETTANQDPLSTKGLVPILGIDVWEHAYYLDYENRRPDYLKEIWKVINWKEASKRFAAK